jgi:hypothetical protein
MTAEFVRWRPPVAAVIRACTLGAGSPVGLAAGAAATDDIRDIRIPGNGFPIWVLVAGGVVFVFGVLAGHAVWRRRRRRRRLSQRSFERALAELEAAHALLLAARGAEFCSVASGVVRRYLERGFAASATPRTTEEFLRSLAQSADGVLARHAPRLAEFLQQCDVVKFAGVPASPERLESLYQSACTFVRESAAEAEDALPGAIRSGGT